jgi:thiamine biosynthesis lipoprotein
MSNQPAYRQFDRQFRAMGTDVALMLWNYNEQRAQNALDSSERFFAQMEQKLSRFLPGSELSQLNRAAGRPFAASHLLFDLVSLALDWRRRTAGIFDPSVLNALVASGYDRSFDSIRAGAPRDGGIAIATPEPGNGHTSRANADAIVLGPGQQITLPAGFRLDLGGIAKGWVTQQAAHRLGLWGPCLVDAGGDIACKGAPPTVAWVVTVADPLTDDRDLAVLTLKDEAVATSTRTYRRWLHNGLPAHHLIDPRTGLPAVTNVLSATVIAPALPDAEIYAKTALILGEVDGVAYLDNIPHIAALLVTEDGRQLRRGSLEEKTRVPFDTFPD